MIAQQQKELLADQTGWVRSYASACGVPPDRAPPSPVSDAIRDCFKRAGQARIAYIRAYGLAGAASPPSVPSAAANTPPAVSAQPSQMPTASPATPPDSSVASAATPPANSSSPATAEKVPLDYSKPIYTDDYAIVCPINVFLDRRVGHGYEAVMDAYMSIFYRTTNAEKAGCQVWHGGIRVRASRASPIPGFVSVDDIYVMQEFDLTNDPAGKSR